MSQTTFWQNSFLSMDVCQQAVWFSVLHLLYMYSVGKFWSVTCLYLEHINKSQWNYKVKTMQNLLINAFTLYFFNFQFFGNWEENRACKIQWLIKIWRKKLQKSNCMAVTLFAMSAKNSFLPPMQLEVARKSVSYKSVGRKPGCCCRLQKRASETPSLEVPGNQPQVGFYPLFKGKALFLLCFLVSSESGKGYNQGALGPKPLDIFGVNPRNECQPCTSANAVLEWLLYYPQQEGRRKFLKDAMEASMCQQEKSSTDMTSVGTCLTWQNLCHKDSAASLCNLGSILSQIADFVNWQKSITQIFQQEWV